MVVVPPPELPIMQMRDMSIMGKCFSTMSMARDTSWQRSPMMVRPSMIA